MKAFHFPTFDVFVTFITSSATDLSVLFPVCQKYKDKLYFSSKLL